MQDNAEGSGPGGITVTPVGDGTYAVEERTEANLDQLGEYQVGVDVLRLRMEEELDRLIPDELKQQAKQIKAQFHNATALTEQEIERLRGIIKGDVLGLGYGVEGESLRASWVAGRKSWDMKKLNRYAQSHPEIEAFRKIGDPSVRIARKRRS